MAKVLNKYKATAEELKNAVYIGRPSKWGNPFTIGEAYQGRILTREDAIAAYEDWLLYSDQGQKVLGDISALNGKDLICYCVPKECHGDILLALANNA